MIFENKVCRRSMRWRLLPSQITEFSDDKYVHTKAEIWSKKMEKKHHQLCLEQGGKKAKLMKRARASSRQTKMERVALCFPKSTK